MTATGSDDKMAAGLGQRENAEPGTEATSLQGSSYTGPWARKSTPANREEQSLPLSMDVHEIKVCVDSLRSELTALAQELVRIPSMTGEETEAQQFLAERWKQWGLKVDLWIPDRDEVAGHPAFCDDGLPIERANVVAQWGEGDPRRAALILNGHMDVVPVGERARWKDDPFSGHIHDGVLYGRGSCDMKSALAAASIAVLAARELDVTPERPVLLQSVIGEETGGLGTLAAILRGYRADAAVIMEPTSLEMCPVASGALSFRLRIPGRSTHGATPDAGVSAIEKFLPIWHGLRDFEARRHTAFRHPAFGGGRLAAPISIGKLQAGDWPSTIPGNATVEGRYGVFPGEDLSEARKQFEDVIHRISVDDEWLGVHPVQLEWFEGQFEPGETAPDAPILKVLSECHQAVTEQAICSHGVPYGNDLRLFTRYANVPAALYGPGNVLRAHAADECIALEEIVTAAEVLTLLICRAVQGTPSTPLRT
jgi:acetylornithine deacetylase